MNQRDRAFSLGFFLILLTGIVHADGINTAPPLAQQELSPLACLFTSRLTVHNVQSPAHNHEWYFWRQGDSLETKDTKGETGQIWERNRVGQISFQRIFHAAKRIITYQPSDLRALESYPEWRKISCLIDPALLGVALKEGEELEVLGRQARQYLGQVNGQELEVWWLVREQIPARIRRTSGDSEELILLKEIYPFAQSPWARNDTTDYGLLDYADLGDKESDPFVRTLFQAIGEEHHH
jgi:hypothetical protein